MERIPSGGHRRRADTGRHGAGAPEIDGAKLGIRLGRLDATLADHTSAAQRNQPSAIPAHGKIGSAADANLNWLGPKSADAIERAKFFRARNPRARAQGATAGGPATREAGRRRNAEGPARQLRPPRTRR